MNSQLKYRWQAAYLSAILEFNPSKMPAKVRKAIPLDYILCVLVFFLVGFASVPLMTDWIR
jgi:hypothetical protein